MEALAPDGHPQKYIYLATMLFTAIAVLHSTMTMQIRWNSTILKKDSKPTIRLSLQVTSPLKIRNIRSAYQWTKQVCL